MRNEIENISNRLHKLHGNGFQGKYVVYFDLKGGVRGEEREVGKGPKTYTRLEFLKLGVPTEPKLDDRPEEVREAQAAMEVAEEEFRKAEGDWLAAEDAAIKLRRSLFGINIHGERGYNKPEAIRNAAMRVEAELLRREEVSEQLRAARAHYNSLMQRWSRERSMKEYAASVEKMQERKRTEVEKRRKTLFGFLKNGGNGNASH